MNQDKFKRRTRDSVENSAPQYDFSTIAGEAVSKARAQSDASEEWGSSAPTEFGGTDDLYDVPQSGRKRFSKRGRGGDSPEVDPWDQPVSREQVESGEKASRRSPFGRRKSEEPESGAHAGNGEGGGKRKISDIVKLLPQSVTGRDKFDRDTAEDIPSEPQRKPGRLSRKSTRNSAENEWDQPVSRQDALGEQPDEQSRSPIGLRKRPTPQPLPEDNWDEPLESRPVQERSARPTYDAGDRSASQEVPYTPAPPPPAPKAQAEQPQRRVFNAATQPNYSYMTDQSDPQPAHQPEPATEGISSLKASLMRRLGKDEPGVEYYTPPANRAPSEVRRHQKRRNRRPCPVWLKAVLFSLCLAAAFFCIVYAAFYIIITNRIDYVGDSVRNTVYLSVEEKANHEADLTDTEENAAEFTEPVSIAEPSESVKVIMVVSSDSQLGSNSGVTARTDAIMLMAVDPANRRIRIASIMTDTYVRIQDYQSNKLSKAYYYDTVVGDYSLTRLKKALEDNFGVIPDNYVIVDFDALQILVERLDGVDVTVTADEAYYMSNHKKYGNFPRFNSEGPYTMSGAEALNYVRMRDVGNSDYDRVARQRKVFSQILVKLQSKSMLELAELAYSILPELPTDMTAGDVFGYLMDLSDIATYEVTEVTFPITNSWRYGTATVRDEAEQVTVADSVISGSDVVSSSDVTSASDLGGTGSSVTDSRPTPDTKFTVIVTNFQFNASALQRYLYENDESYLNGAAANGVAVPEIIAPLESSSPAAGVNPAA